RMTSCTATSTRWTSSPDPALGHTRGGRHLPASFHFLAWQSRCHEGALCGRIGVNEARRAGDTCLTAVDNRAQAREREGRAMTSESSNDELMAALSEYGDQSESSSEVAAPAPATLHPVSATPPAFKPEPVEPAADRPFSDLASRLSDNLAAATLRL